MSFGQAVCRPIRRCLFRARSSRRMDQQQLTGKAPANFFKKRLKSNLTGISPAKNVVSHLYEALFAKLDGGIPANPWYDPIFENLTGVFPAKWIFD
ncbi:hypothetical protein [Bacillus sp. FJAT-26390]|uniref:hypothetical protein n=1 Tax=Bacillus sp. FJAT-26390 TaxID=1743142 RepID=UPI0011463A42|nr:hypothetical protein [Bacillus sp. FJAT-26390]